MAAVGVLIDQRINYHSLHGHIGKGIHELTCNRVLVLGAGIALAFVGIRAIRCVPFLAGGDDVAEPFI